MPQSLKTAPQPAAWANRWKKPSLEQLVNPIRDHQRPSIMKILEEMDAMEGLDREVAWYGSSWNWTIQYYLTTARGRSAEPICYVVPDEEQPRICVPLDEPTLEKLPIKRLGKYVREGIAAAKCAVAIHWATWSPASANEVVQLMDLITRKLKLDA